MAHAKTNTAEMLTLQEVLERPVKQDSQQVEAKKGFYLTAIYYNLALYALMGVLWLAISF